MEKIVKIFDEVYTEDDVKKMTLDEISELSVKICNSISLIAHKRRAALQNNPKADVNGFSSALNFLHQAQGWIAVIKRHKKNEYSKDLRINYCFVQLAKQELPEDKFNEIYNKALKNATADCMALC